MVRKILTAAYEMAAAGWFAGRMAVVFHPACAEFVLAEQARIDKATGGNTDVLLAFGLVLICATVLDFIGTLTLRLTKPQGQEADQVRSTGGEENEQAA